MESIFLLLGLFLLVSFFMPWINRASLGSLRADIRFFQEHIGILEEKLRKLEERSSWTKQDDHKQVEAKKRSEEPREESSSHYEPEDKHDYAEEFDEGLFYGQADPLPEVTQEIPASPIPHVTATEQIVSGDKHVAKSTLELNLATKLPVWVGSVSLIFAAFFLVKYSIEYGWLGPMVRVAIGGVFSGALLVVGCFISVRQHVANAERISQGLIGAGLVGLYVSLYAAVNLHEFLPELLGFVGMAAVTALAVVLSLRHGQPIAVFGVIGGLLTPALVGSIEPNAIGLFVYLFLLFSSLFVVLTRKGWWGLAMFVLLGMFGWSAIWFTSVFTVSEAPVLVVFAMALVAVVLAATGRRAVVLDETSSYHQAYYIHSLNITAIAGGVLTLIGLGFKVDLGLFDWSMLGVLSIALIALTYYKPDIYQRALWAKLATTLVLLSIWAQEASLGNALLVIAGISVVYVGSTTLLMRRVSDPRFWASLQCVSALFLYLISYGTLDFPAWFIESFEMFWGALALLLATLAVLSAADIRKKYKVNTDIQDYVVAIYSLMASAFISLGLAIELPWEYVPLAIAGQIAATAWIYQYVRISFLQSIMYLLTFVFVAMNHEQLMLLISFMAQSIVGEVPSSRFVGGMVLDAPLVHLGVPAILFYLSLWGITRAGQAREKLVYTLFGVANLLVVTMGYYLFKEVMHVGTGHIFSSETSFVGRGVLTMVLAGAGIGIVELTRRFDIEALQPWGKFFFKVAILRFVYFDLFLHNPYWSQDQFVGDIPLFNGITLTYGLGFVASIWVLYNEELMVESDLKRKFYAFTGLVAVFALVSFSVRQYFHGGVLAHGIISSAELYSYSVVWLLSGLVFLAVGIKAQSKSIRLVSMAFIALVVCKVFLLDASELEGLYRVFSFLGLGFSLIGLSYFYSRFVSDDRAM